MAVTGVESMVIQRFKKSAVDGTTVTLVPSTAAWSEAKPTHLAATQVVLTFTARPENMYGAVADDQEYELTLKRVT
jgi:hypothetical protein